jgi:uncharacterized protein (DUF488 family)
MTEGADPVLTAGYADKSLPEFLNLLAEHEVDRVLDVRALADSSQEGFSGDELAAALSAEDVGYLHLASLGDFQPEPYPEHMESEDFQADYERLLEQVEAGRSLLLCACPDLAGCHRRFLARRLRKDGHEVVHLTPAGPKETVTFEGS